METTKKQEALNRITAAEEEIRQAKKLIEKFDSPKDITDVVKSFEDACEITGDDPNNVKFNTDDSNVNAYAKIAIITKALHYDQETKKFWTPDWSNSNQYKYYGYFNMRSSAFAGSAAYYNYGHSNAFVGSRLCFKSKELAVYAYTQFKNLYKAYMLID